jgi:cell wall-associated NlpC family hydrolase
LRPPDLGSTCGATYATDVLAKADTYRNATGGVVGQTYEGDIGIVIATALAQLGKPYVFGTQGPDTFDCSGLVTYAYRAIGIELPAYTFTLINYGTPIAADDIQPGDLIFTRGGIPAEDYGHVAIAINNTHEIQAPQTGDIVKITGVPREPQAIRRIATYRAPEVRGRGETPSERFTDFDAVPMTATTRSIGAEGLLP